jgi:hypothetical protein
MPATHKGRFKPRNPEKYKGDPNDIWFRSSWERDVMQSLDANKLVVRWMSEERCIWYRDPVTKKNRRYFPDFIVEYDRDGAIVTEMIEVKPYRHITGPNPQPKRRTKGWMNEVKTYATNVAKWKAAEEYCEDRGWNWKLLSENEVPSWRRR